MENRSFFVTDATRLGVDDTAPIKEVFVTETALYFRTKENVGVRLSCEGVKGWRLLANASGSAEFDTHGASQALAAYVGEEIPDTTKPIAVTVENGALVAACKCGARVVISLSGDFSLRIHSADGALKTELTGILADDKSVTLIGRLAEGEGVYGGGERLDVANKRGRHVNIFTCDGWDNSNTSYTAVPLFFTTRGGGFLINRYEIAVADFGEKEADVWSYRMDGKDMDAYFYTSEDPAGVLLGYTELSGHAAMPEPWMQGVQICRYSPDFRNFERDICRSSIEKYDDWRDLYLPKGDAYVSILEATEEEKGDAKRFFRCAEDGSYALAYVKNDAGKYFDKGRRGNPLGSSVKTIMESFIKADLKPDAANMEGSFWSSAFSVKNPDAAKKKADLTRAVEWLHAHGMHAMVYMGIGRVSPDKIGFKEEYFVRADVEIRNPDGSVERIENTTDIPWVMGTSENPDVGRDASGKLRSARYLDITNAEAVDWYFNEIWGELINIGIDGVKIDFCEILPDSDKPYGITTTHFRWKDPSRIPIGGEHHAYPTLFISEFYKRMTAFKKAKGYTDGFMVFSRGGGIGSQRSPYMWAGDQARNFEKLDDQLLAVVTSGLSGIPFMSYDMGGYAYRGCNYHSIDPAFEGEVFARASEFTAFMTNVETNGDVRHVYELSEDVQNIYRSFMGLHKELIPYMQKYSRIACDTGMPPVRHPVLKYLNDPSVYDLNDEFLLGDALLVAPILTEQTFERDVYLPAGSWTNLLTDEVIEGGRTVKVAANLGQIPVFLDNNSPDAEELLPIFGGLHWRTIKNYK